MGLQELIEDDCFDYLAGYSMADARRRPAIGLAGFRQLISCATGRPLAATISYLAVRLRSRGFLLPARAYPRFFVLLPNQPSGS